MKRLALLALVPLVPLAYACGSSCQVDPPVIGSPADALAGQSVDIGFDVHTNGSCNNDGRFIAVSVWDENGLPHLTDTVLSQDTSNGLTFHGDTHVAALDAGTYTFDVTVGAGQGQGGQPLAESSKDFTVAP